MDFAIEYPNHYRLMFMTPQPPGMRAEDSRIRRGNPEEDAYAFLRATAAEAIATGRLRPELADADLVSQMVWAGTHGVVPCTSPSATTTGSTGATRRRRPTN